jgi:hypothetical protein
MKTATSPIGSIATKIGIKARKNFSIMGLWPRFHFTGQAFYTMFALFINQTFLYETFVLVDLALRFDPRLLRRRI